MNIGRMQNEEVKSASKAKGDIFEDFFASKLVKVGLVCTERRSDKMAGGKPVLNNSHPDFVWETKASRHEFAVECKYRKRWWKGEGIELGGKGKHDRYAKFAEKRNMPVFIVIAVGGKPGSPENIYIVPLNRVTANFVPKSIVERYRSPHPNGVFEYCEQGEMCALLQGGGSFPQNWQKRQLEKPDELPVQATRSLENQPLAIENRQVAPNPGGGELVRVERPVNYTIILPHTAPLDRPSVRSRYHEVDDGNPLLRRLLWFLGFGLLFSVITLFVWQHDEQKRREEQSAVRPDVWRTRPAAIPVAPPPQPRPEPPPVVRSEPQPPPPAARAIPLLQYKAGSHPFRLSIETVELASDRQVQRAAEDARRAVSLFEPGALPPFFAVPTEPSERTPQLAAYMVFDTQTGSFCSSDVYITASEQSPRTIAIIQRFECFFVTPRWLTDEQRRLQL